MNMLTHNKYLPVYRSLENDFDKDFFIPCYQESCFLERGSGFFSLRSLILDIEGIISFLENDGKIHLICNPLLSEEDINLIIAGYSLEREHITNSLIRELNIEHDFSEADVLALDVICNMIFEKKLLIKIAFMERGVFHDKFGIFTDAENNKVYFSGSANETQNAKVYNSECFEPTLSWEDPLNKIKSQEDYFNRLWTNSCGERIDVIDFPEAVEKHLLEKYKRSETLQQAIEHYQKKKFEKVKKNKSLRPYQEKAILEFVNNGYAHFYEMATGTGKTFTSVKTVEKAEKEKGPLFVMVCVPQTDLQSQWKDAFEECGYDKIYYLGGLAGSKSEKNFNDAQLNYYGDEGKTVVCIAVRDTFFQKIASECDDIDNLFIIVDEAHNLTPQQLKCLPQNPVCRLGLSATLERFIENENEQIKKYFIPNDGKTFYYGVEDAINAKYLSRYRYYPIIVYLTDEEAALYRNKSKAIAIAQSQTPPDDERVQQLLNERRLIIKKASEKITTLEKMLESYPFENSVVYCGQGKLEDESIIDRVTQIIAKKGLRVSQFTSKTIDRARVLEKFSQGYFKVLVAIKCFDEGVDVPKLDKIYIMSSDGSSRQTVQRRGRVLRLCAESGKTEASIYDMIVLPAINNYGESGKSIITPELQRAREYNRLSENKNDNEKIIRKIMDVYNITEEDIGYEK